MLGNPRLMETGEPLQIWWRSVPGYNLWLRVRGSQCACPYSFPPRRWTFPGDQVLHRTQPIFTQGAISQSGNMLTLYEMMFNNLVERSGQRLAERLNCIDPDPLPCLQVFIFDSISAVLVFIKSGVGRICDPGSCSGGPRHPCA